MSRAVNHPHRSDAHREMTDIIIIIIRLFSKLKMIKTHDVLPLCNRGENHCYASHTMIVLSRYKCVIQCIHCSNKNQ